MAKKKNKKHSKSHSPSRAKSPFAGVLADQLKDLKAQLSEPKVTPPKAEPPTTPQPSHSNPRLEASAPLVMEGEDLPLDDGQLFEKALSEMSDTDIFKGKYHGELKAQLPSPRVEVPVVVAKTPQEEDEMREKIEQLREVHTFEQFVGSVDRMEDRGRYYEPKPRPSSETLKDRGYVSESPDSMIAPPLPKSGEGLHRVDELHPAHKGILKRSRLWQRHNEMPVLSVRGDTLEDALRQVELFVHQHWKDKCKYVRLIHGRGLQSEDGKPVLKPAVLQWLEGPGYRYVRGYAPELTQSRDYGSLVVVLSSP